MSGSSSACTVCLRARSLHTVVPLMALEALAASGASHASQHYLLVPAAPPWQTKFNKTQLAPQREKISKQPESHAANLLSKLPSTTSLPSSVISHHLSSCAGHVSNPKRKKHLNLCRRLMLEDGTPVEARAYVLLVVSVWSWPHCGPVGQFRLFSSSASPGLTGLT